MALTKKQTNYIRYKFRNAENKEYYIDSMAEQYGMSTDNIRMILGLKKSIRQEAAEKHIGMATKVTIMSPVQAPARKEEKEMQKSPTRSYNQAVKDDVVKMVLVENVPMVEAAERSGVPYKTVYYWVSKAKEKQQTYYDAAAEIEEELRSSAPEVKRKPAVDNPEWVKAVEEMESQYDNKPENKAPEVEATTPVLQLPSIPPIQIIGTSTLLSEAAIRLREYGLLNDTDHAALMRLSWGAECFEKGRAYNT